jgi:hypothetical protein
VRNPKELQTICFDTDVRLQMGMGLQRRFSYLDIVECLAGLNLSEAAENGKRLKAAVPEAHVYSKLI